MAHWQIDTAHSEIKFRVKHLVVSSVTGHFDRFTAAVLTDREDFSDAQVTFEADAASLNTGNEQRDAHLRSADFFDAEHHPKITFRSTGAEKVSENEYRITGELTIRGITRQIALDVTYNGTIAGFGGQEVAGFEITGRVNRFEYGLHWNALTEVGGVVVGSDVKFEIAAELKKVQEAAKAA